VTGAYIHTRSDTSAPVIAPETGSDLNGKIVEFIKMGRIGAIPVFYFVRWRNKHEPIRFTPKS
jgi:hypothetical protein